MIKHFFFDLDNTLTESRQQISDDVINTLAHLEGDIVIISGASKEQMQKQLNGFNLDFLLSQSGAQCPFWDYKLSGEEVTEIYSHVDSILDGGDTTDKIQNRGSQIALSLIGHNADINLKKGFDPDGKIRKELLKIHPFESKNLEVRIAGTTCLDYTHKDYTKGKNIARLIKKLGWKKEQCIYFGDAFFGGGNDETVKGVIKTVEVKNPKDLVDKLQDYA